MTFDKISKQTAFPVLSNSTSQELLTSEGILLPILREKFKFNAW